MHTKVKFFRVTRTVYISIDAFYYAPVIQILNSSGTGGSYTEYYAMDFTDI